MKTATAFGWWWFVIVNLFPGILVQCKFFNEQIMCYLICVIDNSICQLNIRFDSVTLLMNDLLLKYSGSKLLIRELTSIFDGSARVKAQPQDDSKATLAPKVPLCDLCHTRNRTRSTILQYFIAILWGVTCIKWCGALVVLATKSFNSVGRTWWQCVCALNDSHFSLCANPMFLSRRWFCF